ncbi:DUF2834 domain-containing protein [Marinomonas algicola]|jgi:hypothetical protein|uniref:DUF2834 domain-containing protein n=1 Tax=Marinomonas algicola TaxID=2773454 RepID=UPI00174E02CD|nr:DUF2834 domain-containing protein [Marinomonas algicola]
MMKMYLLFSVLGAVIPFGAFLPWIIDNGLDLVSFYNAATANSISIFAWLDVVIAAIALLVFIVTDGRKNKISHYWVAVFATLTIGVSCGLPLYLYFKEKQRLVLKQAT